MLEKGLIVDSVMKGKGRHAVRQPWPMAKSCKTAGTSPTRRNAMNGLTVAEGWGGFAKALATAARAHGEKDPKQGALSRIRKNTPQAGGG